MADNNKDWHNADIIAALKKQGLSISGLAPTTLSNTLVRPWTKGEWIIANALNTEPQKIRPSRYLNKERKMKTTAAIINKK